MSVSHRHNNIGGIEYGNCGEDKRKEIVSHLLGVSTGYGDAHQKGLTCDGCTRAINKSSKEN